MGAYFVTMLTAMWAGTPTPSQPVSRPVEPAQSMPGVCVYRDAVYSVGATFCVTPTIRLTCQADNKWTETTDVAACESFARTH